VVEVVAKSAHWNSWIQVLFACVMGFYAHCLSAQEYPLKIVTEHWPPYHYLSEDGKLQGSTSDTIKQIIVKAKLETSIDVLSWSKAYDIALHRPNTLIFSIVRTPERENLFDWYCPIAEPLEISMFKLRTRNDIKINELSDAKRFTLGVVRNDYANQFLQANGFSVGQNLLESTDEFANLRQLLSGRIDLVVQVKASIDYRLKKLGRLSSDVENALQSIDGKKIINCLALSLGSDTAIKTALERVFSSVSE
jgi:polar amino acid transport system substrate-binding protein